MRSSRPRHTVCQVDLYGILGRRLIFGRSQSPLINLESWGVGLGSCSNCNPPPTALRNRKRLDVFVMAASALSSRPHLVIVGCGIVGATLAYELSRTQQFNITVVDQHNQRFTPSGPVSAQKFATSTGAALGVLMGVISRKMKGRAWEMRRDSIQRYETLIPELEAATGDRIHHNRQGLLRICFGNESLEAWEKLVLQRQRQGFRLQILGRDTLIQTYPKLNIKNYGRSHLPNGFAPPNPAESEPWVIGAVYSPQDLQVNPIALTTALIDAAIQQGAVFHWGWRTTGLRSQKRGDRSHVCSVETSRDRIDCDGVIITAGLGSSELAKYLDCERN